MGNTASPLPESLNAPVVRECASHSWQPAREGTSIGPKSSFSCCAMSWPHLMAQSTKETSHALKNYEAPKNEAGTRLCGMCFEHTSGLSDKPGMVHGAPSSFQAQFSAALFQKLR